MTGSVFTHGENDETYVRRRGAIGRAAVRYVVVGLAVFVLSEVSFSGLAGADSVSLGADTVATTGQPFYLDLGGSASVGVQPTLNNPRGQRTDGGYANDLVTYEATRGVALDLTQLGCPGESTATMINGGDTCYRLRHTQLRDAIAFLRTHYDDTGIVTLDIGFNNLRRCFSRGDFSPSCVNTQIKQVKIQLRVILDQLSGAAGAGVTFVGVGHYDPFLAEALRGPEGEQYAANSDILIGRLNAALRSVYASEGVAMAGVSDAFQTHDVGLVHVIGDGAVPDNVARACALTWMCQPAPYGPNIHPNDEGYATIATAIEAVLPLPW